MDELSGESSPLHSLHAGAKLFVTILYIVLVVSFERYDFSGMIIMVLYPVLLFQISGLSAALCFYRLRVVLPLVCAVGLFNPLLDHSVALKLGGVVISGGTVSMLTLMLKGVLCLTASYLLIASTPFDAICSSLAAVHLPAGAITLLLLTYRYISLMLEEISIMLEAYSLRAPGQKGIQFSAWGSFLGQLLLRSMDRAEEIYAAMQLRGYDGSCRYASAGRAKKSDVAYTLAVSALLILCRCVNVAQLIGNLFV